MKTLITLALLAVMAAGHARALPRPTGTLKGKVTDRVTGLPLPFVNVIVKETGTGTSTDDDGMYRLSGLEPGVYTLIFSIVGHETETLPGIRINGGDPDALSVSLVDRSVQVGDVIVYGASLRGESITEAPAAITVLTPEEISLGGLSGQVPKLLESQPGVDIVQSGLFDYNVNTRGFNSSLNRRLLVLLDGRDLAVAFLGSQEWNGLSVPVEDLATIELIRGPGSALYGANAFNGVVNILTPRPREIAGGRFSVAGGEWNAFRTDVRYAAQRGSLGYKINAGRSQGKSWSASRLSFPFEYAGFNPFLNSEVVPVNDHPVSSSYGSLRVDYEYPHGSLSTVEGGVTKVENEVLVTGIGRIQVAQAIKPWGRLAYSTGDFSVQVWGAGRTSLEPQISLSTGLPLEERSFTGQADVQYRAKALDDLLYLTAGVSQKYQTVSTDGTLTLASHTDNMTGIYAQGELHLTDAWKVVAAGRWDRSTLHSSQFSPKGGVVWTPSSGHALRLTVNQAFQSPNYSELFLYVKHPLRNLAYLGNENLLVEKITGFEVGYKGIIEHVMFLTLDMYYNRLKDFITDLAPSANPAYPGQVILPGDTILRTIWSYGNAGRVNEYGAELGVDYQLSEKFQIVANYAYFGFEVTEQGAGDVLLPNAPRHKVNGGVTYRYDGLEVNVTGKYVPGFDWAAGIFKGRVEAYAIFGVNASYALTQQLSLSLNVTNLLDREHYQLFGGSFIRRRALLGMAVRF